MQLRCKTLHTLLINFTFILLCVMMLNPTTAGAQSWQGRREHKEYKPYVHSYSNLWHPSPQVKSISGNLHALVILAEYSDVSFSYTREDFENTLKEQDFSARKYFKDQLGQDINITVVGPFKVKRNRSWYGTNDSKGNDMFPGTFIADACEAADEVLDFSLFDDDGDGFVDHVYVFYSGEDESQQMTDSYGKTENSDFMWAHAWKLDESDYGKVLVLDGVKINNYACSSEINRVYKSARTYDNFIAPIGTFCHEHSHIFGLVDLYDTDYERSGGIAAGLWGHTSLMDSGNYNDDGKTPPNYNAISREITGLTVPEEIKPGKYILYPAGDSRYQSYKITNPSDSSEYYLFECRMNEGWDKFIGGKGLLVYHIDKSKKNITMSDAFGEISSEKRWMWYNEESGVYMSYNQVNCRPDHQCADLIEADGRSDLSPSASSMDDISGVFFPQTGATSLGGNSNIKLNFWDGTSSKLTVNDISIEGRTVTFEIRNEFSPIPPDPVAPPADTDMLFIIVQDDGGTLELDVNNTVSATSVKWFFNGSPIDNANSFIPGGNGEIRAEVTWPDGSVDYIFKEWRGR